MENTLKEKGKKNAWGMRGVLSRDKIQEGLPAVEKRRGRFSGSSLLEEGGGESIRKGKRVYLKEIYFKERTYPAGRGTLYPAREEALKGKKKLTLIRKRRGNFSTGGKNSPIREKKKKRFCFTASPPSEKAPAPKKGPTFEIRDGIERALHAKEDGKTITVERGGGDPHERRRTKQENFIWEIG